MFKTALRMLKCSSIFRCEIITIKCILVSLRLRFVIAVEQSSLFYGAYIRSVAKTKVNITNA